MKEEQILKILQELENLARSVVNARESALNVLHGKAPTLCEQVILTLLSDAQALIALLGNPKETTARVPFRIQ